MRRRAFAGAGLVVCCATLTASCSLLPVEENTFGSAALPATTDENAVVVLAGVDRSWSAADAARDPALLAEVVADPLLGIDAATYALDATADPDDASPADPVRHTDPTVFIPRFEGYPQWFVVAAAPHAGGSPQLVVLTRTAAAAAWLVPIAPELLPDVSFPVLALDDRGYVVPLRSDALGDLPIGVAQLAQLHAQALSGDLPSPAPLPSASGAPPTASTPAATSAASTPSGSVAPAADTTARPAPTTASPATPNPTGPSLTGPSLTGPSPTGPSPTGLSPTAPSPTGSTTPPAPHPPVPTAAPEVAAAMGAALLADPWTAARSAADAAAATAVGAAAKVDSTYALGTVIDQALRTQDGGALVFYTLTGDRTYAVTPTYYLQLDATTAALVGKPEVSATLTETWAAQLAVYLPPDPDGVPRVVAARWDRTGLSGS